MDEDQRLIRISLEGAVGDADLINLSRRVRSEPNFAAGWPVLYDCSAATVLLVTGDLVRSLAQSARRDTIPIAFVAPTAAAFGLARMYQIVSDAADRIHVFTNAQDALAWIAEVREKK